MTASAASVVVSSSRRSIRLVSHAVTGYVRCSQESVCRFRRVFFDARNYIANLMDKATLAEVAKGSPVTHKEVTAGFAEFAGGEGI